MCTTCGCGDGETRIDGAPIDPNAPTWRPVPSAPGHAQPFGAGQGRGHPAGAENHDHPHDAAHVHRHADGTVHAHPHAHEHAHEHPHPHERDHEHERGAPRSRLVQVEQDILAKNDALAGENRRRFADHGIFALNLVSSPGSGKTTLLVRTIEAWQGRSPIAVIEGDQQTSRDADRIRATGAPAVQINTGKGCHLDAHMVGLALEELEPADGTLLLIENVGNLVCPAAFDLGEAHKVVILSVTEGEDKPLKYPDMFRAADLLLVNKADLLPHLSFDVDAAIEYARRVRPGLDVLVVSAQTGEGFEPWLAWLDRGVAAALARRDENIAALRRRIAELEAELALRVPPDASGG